jgi:hypothetical protein
MAILGATTLTGCSSIPDFIATGTLVTFQQTSAPSGWTKQTTHNNKALRVVSGTASSGGNQTFTTAFAASRSVSGSNTAATATGSLTQTAATGTVQGTALSTAQLALHAHGVSYFREPGTQFRLASGPAPNIHRSAPSDNAGSGSQHTHPFSGTQHDHQFQGTSHNHPWSGSVSFDVQYVDLIIASKD